MKKFNSTLKPLLERGEVFSLRLHCTDSGRSVVHVSLRNGAGCQLHLMTPEEMHTSAKADANTSIEWALRVLLSALLITPDSLRDTLEQVPLHSVMED